MEERRGGVEVRDMGGVAQRLSCRHRSSSSSPRRLGWLKEHLLACHFFLQVELLKLYQQQRKHLLQPLQLLRLEQLKVQRLPHSRRQQLLVKQKLMLEVIF
jgi:hypothetical protein